jgi:hypothetical protein
VADEAAASAAEADPAVLAEDSVAAVLAEAAIPPVAEAEDAKRSRGHTAECAAMNGYIETEAPCYNMALLLH